MKRIIKINFIVFLILVIFSINCISVFSTEEITLETEYYEEDSEEQEETELDTLKNQKNELDSTLSSTYMQLSIVQSQLSETLYEIEQLNLQIIEKEEEIQNLENEIGKVLASIEVTQKTLTESQEKYNIKKKQLDERLVATYEMGPTTYLDMLLKSKSLSDFLSNYYRISEIAKVDQSLIESFCEISKKIKALSTTLNTNKKILEQSKEANEEAKIVLENLKIIQDGKVKSLNEEDRAIHETIEAKINKDIPFETHFSVISSQSHIRPIAQTVRTKATNNTVLKFVTTAFHHNIEFIRKVIHIHCKNAIGTVNNLVY